MTIVVVQYNRGAEKLQRTMQPFNIVIGNE